MSATLRHASRSVKTAVLILLCGLQAGCAGTRGGGPTPALQVRAIDSAWTTGAVPPEGRCRECGGQGRSPALEVNGVPAGARWVEVRFIDVTARELGWPHFHGALRVAVAAGGKVIVPSVPERSANMPPGVTIAANHGSGHKPQLGYIAPCACDGNNRYMVTVTAGNGDGNLASGHLDLGHCCLR